MESRDCNLMKMFESWTHICCDIDRKDDHIRWRSVPSLSASIHYIVSKHFHIVSVLIRCSCSTQIQSLFSPPSNENRFVHTEGQTKQAPRNADKPDDYSHKSRVQSYFLYDISEVFCALNKTKGKIDFLKYASIRLGGHFMSSRFDSIEADNRNYSHETTQTLATPSALSGQQRYVLDLCGVQADRFPLPLRNQ